MMRAAPFLVAGLLTVLAACGGPSHGPLGVVDRQAGNEPEAAIQGQLRITGGCVDLVTGDQEVGLLFWSSLDPEWDETSQSVALEGQDGDPVTFRDGDTVSLGGGSSSAEGSPSESYYSEETGWISEPARACRRDVRFEVASVAGDR